MGASIVWNDEKLADQSLDGSDDQSGDRLLSILAPVYNEAENIRPLCEKLVAVLSRLGVHYEIILVDDGSADESFEVLDQMASANARIKVISLRRNYGQTAALMAAIDHSAGDILIPIDADLQNDPEDIPKLLEKLDSGYDVVSGWRRNRRDSRIRRVLVSRIANALISWISGVRLRDYGCSLKVYRREVLQGVRLYGEMHRFVPIYASWSGARVTEIPVRHHPRIHGSSKYGLERTVKVILDLMVVKFLDSYFTKPIYVFGSVGILSIFISFLTGGLMIYLRLVQGIPMILTPLPMLAIMTFITGMMSLLLGLLAEILVRTYFESQQKQTYVVGNRINL